MKLENEASAARMPQLDGLRGTAALVVVLSHNRPAEFVWPFELGVAAVYFFFVLSGFLITGILLHTRTLIDTGACSLGRAFRIFYARRALRLCPAYYLALLSLWALDVPRFRDYCAYYAAYLANYVFFMKCDPEIQYVWHFWSLSIEEQFYLIWPILVLLAPRRIMVALIMIGVLLSPLFRVYYFIQTDLGFKVNCVPWCSLDGLGLGSILAITRKIDPKWHQWRDRLLRVALISGLCIIACELVSNSLNVGYLARYAFANLGYSLASCWVVARGAEGFSGRAGTFLASRPLVYLGTISYGIYLNHELIVPWCAWLACQGIGFEIPTELSPFRTLVVLALSIGFASLSWNLIEEPIGRLKTFFRYRPDRTS